MENLKELLRKFYNGGIYKATGEKGVAYINHRPSFEEMYEALNKSDVISSVSESGIRLDLDKILKAKDTFKKIL